MGSGKIVSGAFHAAPMAADFSIRNMKNAPGEPLNDDEGNVLQALNDAVCWRGHQRR